MEFFQDRRLFKRYKHKADFYINIKGDSFKASMIDFSLSGLCIFIEEIRDLSINSIINIKIEDMNLDIQSRVVWTKKSENNLIVGLEKLLFDGLLRFYHLPDILLDLQRSDSTGVLELIDGPIYKKIFIKDGVMVFAASTHEEDRLEEVLLRAGKLTNDQYYQIAGIPKQEGQPLGKILIERGFLKPEELIWAVKHQAEEIILSLFRWEDGVVSFIEGSLPDEAIPLKLSAANLIFQGIKRINNSEYFKNICPAPDTILYYSSEPLHLFQDIHFSGADREVLSLIDGTLTLKEILNISAHGDFLTMKILCAMLSTRMLEVKGERILEDRGVVEIIREPRSNIDSAFIRKVDDLYSRYQSMDYYTILGIDRNASLSTIRKAYYKSAKEFHPDKHFYIESETIRDKLTKLFAYITDAYRTVSDKEEKRRYDEKLKEIAKGTTVKESKTDTAKLRFEEGKAAFKKGMYQDAAEFFGQAIYLDSIVPAYHFALGRAYVKQKKFREAEKAMSKAVKIDPYNADYLAELGSIYEELGLKLRAKTTFEKALKFDPANKRALEGSRNG